MTTDDKINAAKAAIEEIACPDPKATSGARQLYAYRLMLRVLMDMGEAKDLHDILKASLYLSCTSIAEIDIAYETRAIFLEELMLRDIEDSKC